MPAGTRGPCARKCTRVDHRFSRGHPGLPCANGFTAYFVLSPVRRALLPPSPRGFLGVSHPVGANASHGLDASFGRQDHTIWPSADALAGLSMAGVCSPSKLGEGASQRRSSARRLIAHGRKPALQPASRPTLPRPPHPSPRFVTTRTPLVPGGTNAPYANSCFGKREIFSP